MQDSQITITVTAVDGATKVFQGVGDNAVKQASRAASAWQKANDVADVSIQSSGEAATATNNASKAQDNLTESTKRSYFAQTALTTILSAGINKAFLTMVDVTGQAIQRVDLIANFPKTMQALGISATDASTALSSLSNYVASVGGNLQDATTTVTRFTEVTKNVKAATAEFVGVNNALIAGGASSQVQADALEQLTQAYSRGVPQLIEWKSLMVAMPAQLNLVAKAMGQPNAQALGTQLTNGKISMQDFMTELTKLSTGTGPIAAQANAHLSGIQFGFNQFKNALVTGMTEIIQAVGRQNITNFFSLLTGVVKELATWAVALIGILLSLFNAVSQVFGGPQLALAKDSTSGIADNLGAGASNAGDLANNLNNANTAAAKTAAQLAAFDKMNVLTPATPAAATPGTGALSPADASALDGIFGDIAAKMQNISGAAKILAGIIAGLAGLKFAQGLLNQFNGMIDTIKTTASNIDKLSQKLDDLNKKILGIKTGGDSANKTTSNLFTAIGKVAQSIGNFGAIGLLLSKLSWTPLIESVGETVGVIVGAIASIPIALVAAIALAVVAVVAAIFLIWKNWDTIWPEMKKVASDVWDGIKKATSDAADAVKNVWNGITKFFSGIWDSVKKGVSDAFDAVGKTIVGFFTAVAANPAVKVITDIFKFLGDVITALVDISFALLIDGILLVIQNFQGWWTAIVGIFSGVAAWFGGIFTDAWNAIVAIWSVVAGWFNTAVWLPTVAIFSGVAAWFGGIFTDAWNAIVAVWNGVSAWFNVSVWLPLVSIFTPVISWFGGIFSSAWGAIVGVWNGVSAWFQGVWNAIAGVFSGVAAWFGGVFSGAWNAITGAFKNIQSFFGGLWGVITSGLKSALQGGINTIYNFMNDVGDTFNNFIKTINGLSSKVHGPQITFTVPRFSPPQLAQGGIVDQPTLVQVGEAGKEAIVPLENNTEWIDKLAAKINTTKGGASATPVNLTVQIGEDKVANKIINLINEKTQMSGRNTILV